MRSGLALVTVQTKAVRLWCVAIPGLPRCRSLVVVPCGPVKGLCFLVLVLLPRCIKSFPGTQILLCILTACLWLVFTRVSVGLDRRTGMLPTACMPSDMLLFAALLLCAVVCMKALPRQASVMFRLLTPSL